MNTDQKTVALVMSGGGARGMAHIGVIKALEENGYRISSIAGTSIGALIGGIYLSGKLDEFVEWTANIGKYDLLKFMDFAINKSGLIKGEKVFQKLKPFVNDVKIESLSIPYAAVAVDIMSHTEVVFSKGSLVDAIRASAAIPTVLRPFNLNDRFLVDGGVLNPLPIDVVKRNPGDLLIAVDLNADIPFKPAEIEKPEKDEANQTYEKALQFINEKWSKFFKSDKSKSIGFFDLITQSIYAMQIKLTQAAIEKHQPDVVVRISKNSCEMFEFHKAVEQIAYGRKQLENKLQEFNK
ncbi:MAG: patatin-like phospholipase family protein [Bacteroidales bacterium]|nr:patatin-like phospholipase family protein [Bacteroidales bacterium]